MLDIGFPELLLVALVILLVFGPERLPEVLRTLGGWIGHARRSFTSLKNEIEREIGADDIRRELHNARILEEAKKVREEIEAAAGDLRAGSSEVDALVRKQMTGQDAGEQAQRDAQPDTGQAPADDDAQARTAVDEDPASAGDGAASGSDPAPRRDSRP